MTSMSNSLTIQFVSDASIAHEGFSAGYTSLNATTGKYHVLILAS